VKNHKNSSEKSKICNRHKIFITNGLDIFPSFSIPAVLHSLVVNDTLQGKLYNGLLFGEKSRHLKAGMCSVERKSYSAGTGICSARKRKSGSQRKIWDPQQKQFQASITRSFRRSRSSRLTGRNPGGQLGPSWPHKGTLFRG